MSFSTEPKAAPTLVQPQGTQMSARDRAIAALTSAPVPNPTSIAPEEMSAISSENRQTSNNETPDAPQAETKAAEEPISSQYAVLARKEKALRMRDQQLRQREAAIRATEAAKASPTAPSFDESKYISKDRLQKDPFAALNEIGLNYEQLTNLLLNAPSPEAQAQQDYTSKLEARLAALEAETGNVKKTFEERDLESRKAAVTQIKSEVSRLVFTDPAFETIKETNSISDVVDLIEQTFDKDGILLTVEDASQMVEEYLVEEAMKIARIKKIQQRLAPQASAPQATTGQPKQQQLKTLTNSISSTRQLTSKERAVLAFQGKLTK